MNYEALVSAINTGEPDHFDKVAFNAPQGVKDAVSFCSRFYMDYGTMPTIAAIEQHFNITLPTEVAPWAFWEKEIADARFLSEIDNIFSTYNREQEHDRKSAVLNLRDSIMGVQDHSSSRAKGTSILRDTSRWERFRSQERLRIKTGIKPLDDISGGLYAKGDYWVLTARLKVGKSWVAQWIGANISRTHRVGIASLEMNEDLVGARVDSIVGHVKNSSLLLGKEVPGLDELKEKYNQHEGDYIVLTRKDCNGHCYPKRLRQFVRDNNLDVLIIDQVSLLYPDPGTKYHADHEMKAAISFQIASLVEELQIPVIAVNQLNREAAKQEASAENIAGSDRFAQDATCAISLERSGESGDILKMKILAARKFRIPDAAWEFTLSLDEGIFEHRVNAMDGVRARHATATVNDTQAAVDAQNPQEDEELI